MRPVRDDDASDEREALRRLALLVLEGQRRCDPFAPRVLDGLEMQTSPGARRRRLP